MSGRIVIVSSLALAAGLALIASGCGEDAVPAAGAQPPGVAGAQAVPGQPQVGAQPAMPSAAALPPGDDPEKECLVQSFCERKCSTECAQEERDRTAYFQAKRARLGSAPFEVKVTRIYIEGSCAQGDDPAKRKASQGLKAVVDGELTYTGVDMIYDAELGGELYLRFDANRYAEAYVADKTYTGGWYSRVKEASRFDRPVRGADPWVTGQARPFHWESRPLSEAFCEVMPDEATVFIELATVGVRQGRARHAITFAGVNWDEVLGMAMRQQVSVLTKKDKDIVLEPADAIYAALDKILVTRLTGKTEWLKRSGTVQAGEIPKAPAAAFPIEAASEQWKVKVAGVSSAKEFGGYVHKGEDQFLALVDVTLEYTGEGSASASKAGLRLETAPGKWVKPIEKAMGQLDLSSDLASGSSISGKVVFPRQRFQRPYRLEIKTPDKATLLLDVFSYDVGSERAPK
jgi:hypothetical protein